VSSSVGASYNMSVAGVRVVEFGTKVLADNKCHVVLPLSGTVRFRTRSFLLATSITDGAG